MTSQIILSMLAVTPTPVPTGLSSGGPPLSLTLMLACTGFALALVFGILILGFIAGSQSRKAFKEQKSSTGKPEKN